MTVWSMSHNLGMYHLVWTYYTYLRRWERKCHQIQGQGIYNKNMLLFSFILPFNEGCWWVLNFLILKLDPGTLTHSEPTWGHEVMLQQNGLPNPDPSALLPAISWSSAEEQLGRCNRRRLQRRWEQVEFPLCPSPQTPTFNHIWPSQSHVSSNRQLS